jgi:hypothetical protein
MGIEITVACINWFLSKIDYYCYYKIVKFINKDNLIWIMDITKDHVKAIIRAYAKEVYKNFEGFGHNVWCFSVGETGANFSYTGKQWSHPLTVVMSIEGPDFVFRAPFYAGADETLDNVVSDIEPRLRLNHQKMMECGNVAGDTLELVRSYAQIFDRLVVNAQKMTQFADVGLIYLGSVGKLVEKYGSRIADNDSIGNMIYRAGIVTIGRTKPSAAKPRDDGQERYSGVENR